MAALAVLRAEARAARRVAAPVERSGSTERTRLQRNVGSSGSTLAPAAATWQQRKLLRLQRQHSAAADVTPAPAAATPAAAEVTLAPAAATPAAAEVTLAPAAATPAAAEVTLAPAAATPAAAEVTLAPAAATPAPAAAPAPAATASEATRKTSTSSALLSSSNRLKQPRSGPGQPVLDELRVGSPALAARESHECHDDCEHLTDDDRTAIADAALSVAGISNDDVTSAYANFVKGDKTAVDGLLTQAAVNLGMPSSAGLRDQILPSLGINLGSVSQ